ncbi:hypothetical protein BAU14_09610 [Enterococcus sp. CU9D]|nr:hypothetical protein BAU14_09610 [Enterococcus sp. CU9D]
MAMGGILMKEKNWKQNLLAGLLLALKIWVPIAVLLLLVSWLFHPEFLRTSGVYVQSFAVVWIMAETAVVIRRR